MSTLIDWGRLGQVYLGWYAGSAEDGNAALDLWCSRGEWEFTFRMVHVIVTPPSVVKCLALRRNGAELWVV